MGRPPHMMIPHIFNYEGNFRTPKMVLTPKLVALGVGTPHYMHPYFKNIIKWYNVAPIQLSPNNYKLAIAVLILYRDKGHGFPTMEEFNYFFSLKKCSEGYFFLVMNKKYNKKGFLER